jgi:tight adherence protein B
MTMLAVFVLAGVAAAGVLLAFAVLATSPSPELAPGDGGAGLRGSLDHAFQGIAERVSERERRRGRTPLPERLARAGLRLKPTEYLMAQVGCAVVLAGLAYARFGVSPVLPVAGFLGLLVPGFYLKFRIGRRLKRMNNQLVDVLGLMANSLKAGHSLPQTLELISRDARPPIAEEFARCVRELQVGGSMEAALANLARRSGSEDLELMVTAVLVQMTVGGNLAGMLETIAHTIRERVRIKGEISAATAQGRLSGWIVTGMPVAVAGILFLISPTYFRPMTTQLFGWIMLGAAGVLILVGNLIINKIVKIKV